MIMTKMDKIWIATASLLYPETSTHKLLDENGINEQIKKFWPGIDIDMRMLREHLVSTVRRVQNPQNPNAGGSRNRYLFRSEDGISPSIKGKFRLYKGVDSQFDGKEKDGKYHPSREDIETGFQYLVDWYCNFYF